MDLGSCFIGGFAWPVPQAFASAVSACRFEQGDVLYSDAAAYHAWPEGAGALSYHIQVLDPPRAARALTRESEGKRFFANWESPVEIELTRLTEGRCERHATSQGRLFSCLWRGDVALLQPDTEPAPEPPALQRDLHRQLDTALPAFRSHFEAERPGRAGCLYISVVDRASDASRAKARAIESVLSEAFLLAVCDLDPAAAGLPRAERFHPALLLRGLAVDVGDPAPVEALLKAFLYSPVEGKTDRFALSRHGLLVV